MEKIVTIKVSISNTKPMFDDDGIRLTEDVLEKMIFQKIKETITDYISGGGVDIDFLNSEFGVDEAEDLTYYGDLKVEVQDE